LLPFTLVFLRIGLAAIALIIAAKILKIQFPKSKIIILAFIFIGPDYFYIPIAPKLCTKMSAARST